MDESETRRVKFGRAAADKVHHFYDVGKEKATNSVEHWKDKYSSKFSDFGSKVKEAPASGLRAIRIQFEKFLHSIKEAALEIAAGASVIGLAGAVTGGMILAPAIGEGGSAASVALCTILGGTVGAVAGGFLVYLIYRDIKMKEMAEMNRRLEDRAMGVRLRYN